ncbi:MAG: helix-turn-helix domain-containing protein [Myxococcaceae bacterium]
MKAKKLLNTNEAGAYLGFSARTVYQLARRGDLPALRVGRVLRFDPAQLDGWRTSRSTTTAEPEPIEVPIIRPAELTTAGLEQRLLVTLLAEQRQTNRLLARLLNRGGAR